MLLLAALSAERAIYSPYKKLFFISEVNVIVEIILCVDAVCITCTQALVEMLLVVENFADKNSVHADAALAARIDNLRVSE